MLGWLLGRRLANSDDESQKVGPLAGIPILGLDALTSSAYGLEAALTVLMPVGAIGLSYGLPITSIILVILFMVFVSYRQTIEAYPSGGGSYTVAHENLGRFPGLLAAAALMLDYVLTVAVGIAAGIGALISAVPFLQPHILALCLIILLFITIINLRGIKESGTTFMAPTYLFLFSLLTVLGIGIVKAILSGGHPHPADALPPIFTPSVQVPLTTWLLLRAFASGCAAMTGVEAVSNGVKAFKDPVVANARRTLTAIVVLLIVLLSGIAYLCRAYGISPTDATKPGYESMVSQLIRAVVGHGAGYYITISSVICVLALSANTAFADFPRLCQIVSHDNYLPHALSERGRRLVFSYGIITLAVLSGILLTIFDGITDRLIPLYAIGAFLAFTLSQSGMVVHWVRQGARKNLLKLIVNACGAIATGVTLIIVLISKFAEGGWISALIVPCLLVFFYGVHRHYRTVLKELETDQPLSLKHLAEPIVIVAFREWNKMTRKSLGFAILLSQDIYAVHVEQENDKPIEVLDEQWHRFIAVPCQASKVPVPQLIKLKSPYRKLFGSLVRFVDELEAKFPDRRLAFVIPYLSEHKWYHYFLHNQRAVLLNAVLLLRRDRKITIVTVPWFLDS